MNDDRSFLKSLGGVALATVLLLLIPLVAMQFSEDVVWTASDFIVAGIMLFGTGLTYTLVTRMAKGDTPYKIALGFALFSGLFLIWANLAVGIIGSEDNPANLMYYGVIAVGLIGASWARFKAWGMVRVMSAMAITQALIALISLISGMHQSPVSSMTEIINVNGFFVTLFVVAALLFRHAALEQAESSAEPEVQ